MTKTGNVIFGISIIATILCNSLGNYSVSGQSTPSEQMKDAYRFPRSLGFPFAIAEKDVNGFESFQEVYIGFRNGENWTNAKIEADGKLLLSGDIRTKDGSVYKFRRATLERESGGFFKNFMIVTESVDGWHYEFNGSFYDGPQRREGGYVDLIGELSLLQNDKVVVKRTFEFSDLAIE